MTDNLRKIEGGKPHTEMSAELCDAITDAIDTFRDKGLSGALVIGALELVKYELMVELSE